MNILFLILCATQPERFEALPKVYHVVHAENTDHKIYVFAKTDGQPFKVPVVNGIIPSVVQFKDEWGNVTRREFYYDRKVLYTGQEVLDYQNPQEIVEIIAPPQKPEVKPETTLPESKPEPTVDVATILAVAQTPPKVSKEEQDLFKDVSPPKTSSPHKIPEQLKTPEIIPVPQNLPPNIDPIAQPNTDQICVTPCSVNVCRNYCAPKCRKVHRKCRR